ncbi:RagB/SusD family nutrient uptake outer membrane protein [Flavobacterium luteum]|uniref:RagB/SusD family nutrient uptake outer membrane protein n=1 Tax=Flavobacterium luteum TaxID=2026654 RepID=A0A7J5AF70_9FLAO|nr:RagB/SusD family nutrient uptake outer membrane protein [Flavobacterium luteum]KAB1156200.1 RagB/SusD family nutrient uptake outer membrane protein [Flavobacterium luteum]
MKNIKLNSLGLLLSLVLISSCTDDLNTENKIDLSPDQVKGGGSAFIIGSMSKVYSTFALSGSNGPGSTDTPGDDAGESPFLRGIINLEDFTADGMKNRWGDNGLDQLTTTANWDENNKFFRYVYNRVYYTVPQANRLIDIIKKEPDLPNKERLISEMRFLRSLAYFYLIDCFGKGTLLTEADLGVTEPKSESTRRELFKFVTDELTDICDAELTSSADKLLPFTNTYGRANRSVARMLLAKLYLNAEVYIGENKYAQAYKYSKLVIDEGGYKLADSFRSLFCRDNNVTDAKNEIIYPLIADPITSQSYGNTTYLINGSLSSATMDPTVFGNPGGDSNAWGGHRATKAWYGLFANSAQGLAESSDDRARLFYTNYNSTDLSKIHNYEMNDYKKWVDGFPSIKFVNTNFSGIPVSPVLFAGTDFPLYRLGDAYLMVAESILRGGGGTAEDALFYVNAIRTRSNASPITSGELTLDFILDERARELNFEGHRRTDLIRYGKFTGGSYLWPWKGGVKDGNSIPSHYDLFPIPLKAIQANPKLTQNSGYN